MSLQAKYFIIAVIIFGSAGIWLPIGLEALSQKKITFHNIPPNVTTYFISLICAGCIDIILVKLKKLDIQGIAHSILNIILIVIVAGILIIGAILLHLYYYDKSSLIVGLISILISYRIWWLANIGNANFSSNSASLGGDTNRPLTNG